VNTTTNRVRRHGAEHDADVSAGESALATRIVAETPPAQARPPRPSGELSAATPEDVVIAVGEAFAGRNRNTLADYRHGMRRLLEILQQHPGGTWQERWEAAGLNEPGHPVGDLAGDDPKWRGRLQMAAGNAYCMRLIRPTLPALRATCAQQYTDRFRAIARDALLEEFCTRLERHPVSRETKDKARLELCYALTVFGIDLGGVTPGALVLHGEQSPGRGIAAAWPLLHGMGLIPAWVPRTLQDARIRGRRSVEDLVDRHQLRNREVRDLMVEYLRRRSAEVDYATTENLVRCLVEYFWKIIEQISPDQADLFLTEEQVQAWKERLLVRKDGKPRTHIEAPFLTVRGFYLDLQTWAAAEPAGPAGSRPARSGTPTCGGSTSASAGSASGWPPAPASASRCWRSSPSTSTTTGSVCASSWTPRARRSRASSSPSTGRRGSASPSRAASSPRTAGSRCGWSTGTPETCCD
jgi:hypothetical protein